MATIMLDKLDATDLTEQQRNAEEIKAMDTMATAYSGKFGYF